MSQNPYMLVFGQEPMQKISRYEQKEMVLNAFKAERGQPVFMITGVRGIGKTVFMTEIADQFRNEKDWIVTELNPEVDMRVQLASQLSSEDQLARIFRAAKINLSFFGFGLEVSDVTPVTDIEDALKKMLSALQKKNKKVLVNIDEVTNTTRMHEFAAAFQILLRLKLPIYLLMTGLYENIRGLQDENSLTFLYRTPRIELQPLNLSSIAYNYKVTFHIPETEAREMADMTNGYSFAFQALGWLRWQYPDQKEYVYVQYRQILNEYVYEKVWSELSRKDRTVAYAIAKSETGKIDEIRQLLNMTSSQFNPYRKRLIDKGILDGRERGYVKFVLPLFAEYVKEEMSE